VYVVDGTGQLISHSDISLVLRKTDLLTLPQVRRALSRDNSEGSLGSDARDIDGAAVFSIASPIEHLGWTVFAEQPQRDALRPVYASITRSIASSRSELLLRLLPVCCSHAGWCNPSA
jgi:hypothetical protein